MWYDICVHVCSCEYIVLIYLLIQYIVPINVIYMLIIIYRM